MIAGSSLTAASNILIQEINPVNAPQCCPSRGWQHVTPDVDLKECTLHLHYNAHKEEPTLALKPRGDITRNLKQGAKIGHVNVSDKKTLQKKTTTKNSTWYYVHSIVTSFHARQSVNLGAGRLISYS